jgi:hypothetical protein
MAVQLIFDERAKIIQWKKHSLFSKNNVGASNHPEAKIKCI